MKIRRISAALMTVIMTVGQLYVPSAAKAPGPEEMIAYTVEKRLAAENMPSEDDLLLGYLMDGEDEKCSDHSYDNADGEECISEEAGCAAVKAGDSLNAVNRYIYDTVVDAYTKIASGNRADVIVDIVLPQDLNPCYTGDELGEELFDETYNLRAEAAAALEATIGLDMSAVYNAIYYDHPYIVYWQDLNAGMGWGYVYQFTDKNGEWALSIGDIQWTSSAGVEYRPNGAEPVDELYTSVDTDKTRAASDAKNNAQNIVAAAKEACTTDEGILKYYCVELCKMTSYNYASLGEAEGANRDGAHGVIYALDNDPDTKVVCDGYSRAYQMLCDMTDFYSEDVSVYRVTGGVSNENEELGAHAWNIAVMDDGRGYHIDTTWSDEEYEGNDNYAGISNEDLNRLLTRYFMLPVTEDNLDIDNNRYTVVCDNLTINLGGGWVTTVPGGTETCRLEDSSISVHPLSFYNMNPVPYVYGENLAANNTDITIAPLTYTGSTLVPVITVKRGAETLTPGTDYTVTIKQGNNTVASLKNAGSYTAVITGGGDYSGSVSKTFTVAPKEITPTVTVTGTYVYNVNTDPVFTVKDESTVLTSGTDYTATVTYNTAAGEGTIIISDVEGGNYSFSDVVQSFTVEKAPSPSVEVSVSIAEETPVNKTYGDADFTLHPAQTGDTGESGSFSYSSNAEEVVTVDNTGTVRITGTGTAVITVVYEADMYFGSLNITVNVAKKKPGVSWTKTELVYNGSEQMPEVSLSGIVGDDEVIALTEGANILPGSYQAVLSLTGADALKYTITEADAKCPYTIAKAVTKDKSAVSSARYGLTRTVDLKDLIMPGGKAAIRSVSGNDAILDKAPEIKDGKLEYAFKNDEACAGKSVQVLIEVSDADYFENYNIAVTLTVLDCLHEYDQGRVTKEPTVFAEGEKIYTCRLCGHTRTEILKRKPGEEEFAEVLRDIDPEADKVDVTTKHNEDGSTETVITIGDEVVSSITADPDGAVFEETKIWIAGLKSSYTFCGEAIKPEIHVYDGLHRLTESSDYTVSYKKNKKSGKEAKLVISFRGSYKSTEKKEFAFEIKPAKLGTDVIAKDGAVSPGGKPAVNVIFAESGKKVPAKDLDITCSGDTGSAGTLTVSIKPGSSDYSGSMQAQVTVTDDKLLMLENAKVKTEQKKYTYTGKPVSANVTVELDGKELVKGVDYTVSQISNNINPGTATMVLEAVKGNAAGYVGSRVVTFKIVKGRVLEKSDGFVFEMDEKQTYEKDGVKPALRVLDGDTILKEGEDYKLSVKGNKKAGSTGSVTVKGKGKYKGSVTLGFTVEQSDISKLNVVSVDAVAIPSGKDAGAVIIDVNKKQLKENTDYIIVPDMLSPVGGKYMTMIAKGQGNYKGQVRIRFRDIDPSKDISGFANSKISAMPYAVSGATVDKSTLMGLFSDSLVYGKDYIVAGYINNIKPGTAKVIIKGIGEYGGAKLISFKVKGKKAEIRGAYRDGVWK